jgi:predicted dehydrogenase
VRLASAHGADALVEKPLARDGAATRALVEVTGKAGTRLCPVHQYAFQRGVEQIRDSLHRVGDNALIDLDFRTAGAVGCDPADYARIAADILPHPISILQRLVPSAADGPVNWQISGQPNGTFTLSKVADSALIRITISLMARPTCATLAVSGSKGSYVSDMFHGYALFRDGTATRQSKMMRPFLDGIGHVGLAGANLARRAFSREAAYPGLRTLCSRFYASVQNQTPPPISPDEMIQVAAIRDGFLARLDADSRAGPT